QMDGEEEVTLGRDDDTFTETSYAKNALAFDVADRRDCRSQQERARQSDPFQDGAADALVECFAVDQHVGQLRHRMESSSKLRYFPRSRLGVVFEHEPHSADITHRR